VKQASCSSIIQGGGKRRAEGRSNDSRARDFEAGHAVAGYPFSLPIKSVVIRSDGTGSCLYDHRQFFSSDTTSRWPVSAYAGVEAEVDRFGDARSKPTRNPLALHNPRLGEVHGHAPPAHGGCTAPSLVKGVEVLRLDRTWPSTAGDRRDSGRDAL
jgi:hypothetical protein